MLAAFPCFRASSAEVKASAKVFPRIGTGAAALSVRPSWTRASIFLSMMEKPTEGAFTPYRARSSSYLPPEAKAESHAFLVGLKDEARVIGVGLRLRRDRAGNGPRHRGP